MFEQLSQRNSVKIWNRNLDVQSLGKYDILECLINTKKQKSKISELLAYNDRNILGYIIMRLKT